MKTRDIQTGEKLVTSEGLTGNDFGIRPQDVNFILSILRDGMYEDPIGSLCRELISNCVDAHKEAGKSDLPIEVILPSTFESSIKFIDYGLGMSPEFIDENYRNFGASSKCYSNDYIGGLGVGSKSPWAYSDSFTVETIHKGIKYTYSCYIDEYEKGKIFLLNQEETNLSSGTTVTVPVKSKDYPTFQDRVVFYSRYLPVKPITTPSLDLSRDPFISNERYECNTKSGSSLVVVGGIPYPINVHSLPSDLRSHTVANIGAVYFCNVGDVDVAANRESLKLTPKTNAFIKRAFDDLLNTASTEYSKKLQNCANLLEATLKKKQVDWNFTRIFLTHNPPKYKGTEVSSSYGIFSKENITLQTYYLKSNNLPYLRNERYSPLGVSVDISANSAIFINDIGTSTETKYIQAIFNDNPKLTNVYVIKGVNKVISKSELSIGKDAVDIELLAPSLLSSITPVERTKSTTNGTTKGSATKVKKPKGLLRVYKFDLSHKEISRSGLYKHGIEEILDISKKKGIYLKVDNAKNEFFSSSIDVQNACDLLSIKDLYMVKKQDWNAFDKSVDWLNLEDLVLDEVKRLVTKNILIWKRYRDHKLIPKYSPTLLEAVLKDPKDSIFKKYLETYTKCYKAYEDATSHKFVSYFLTYLDRVIANLDPTFYNDLINLEKDCKDKYPLLFTASTIHFSKPKHIMHYVHAVDIMG